jgi:hypothetical protein
MKYNKLFIIRSTIIAGRSSRGVQDASVDQVPTQPHSTTRSHNPTGLLLHFALGHIFKYITIITPFH